MLKKLFLIMIFFVFSMGITDSRGLKLYLTKHKNEKKVALVIGNGDYSKFRKLPNALNDASDVRDRLKQMGFRVIYGKDLTRREIIRKLREFNNQLNHKSVALFYYAGHGLEVKNINYILPLKADIESKTDVPYEAVSLNRVVDEMKVARLKIVVVDACRNNPFGRGVEKTTFAPLNADGTILAFGTSSGDEASENSNDRNGLFTKYFLQTLNKPNLNQRDFFAEIRREVYLNSNKEQKPAFYDETIGDFYFNIDISKLKHKEVISNAQKPDEILWNKIKNSKNIEDYNFFIKLYPNSAYVSLAKFSIMKLQPKKMTKQVVRNSSNDKVWIDPDTNLMWQVDISTKKYNWYDAKKYCSNLNLEGYSDWRLPSYKEIYTIKTKNSYYSKSITQRVYIKKPLLKSIYNLYGPQFWSSTFQVKNPYSLIFYMPLGTIDNALSNKDKTSYVRCVRGDKLKNKIYSLTINTIPSSARVYITNIKPTYYDGMILKEAKYNIKIVAKGYETKKFSVNLKKDTNLNITLKKMAQTTTNLNNYSSNQKTWIDPDTGLMWQNEKYTQKEKKAFDKLYNYGKVQNWKGAKEYCSNLNYAGYSDWRLPNRKELKTIVTKTKYQSSNGYKYYIKKIFLNKMPPLKGRHKWAPFWSSTSFDSDQAWRVYFKYGYDHNSYKYHHYYVRCVRNE